MKQWVHRISAMVGAFVLLAALMAQSAGARPSAGSLSEGSPPGRYIVVLDDAVERPGRVAIRHAENRGAQVSQVYSHALKGYAAKIDRAELGALRQDPNVAYIEPDARGGIASQEIPTGISRTFAFGNKALDIDEKNDRPVDVDVAVFDTGIASHPDLNVVERVTCSGQPCKLGGVDGRGHGTHVAGTIGAIDNGFGVVGVAPGARLWAIKVLNDAGSGYFSELIAGIDWVTATREDPDPGNDIEVTNASLRYWSAPVSQAFNEALEASIDAGIVHVAAAGNQSEEVAFLPGVHPDEITVSAVEDLDGSPIGTLEGGDPLAEFSNFGTVVDVAAPGVDILSTYLGNTYKEFSGTSTASPHVAGAAAILAATDPPASREDVESIRDTIVAEGNLDWVDLSQDEAHEPLLDVSDEEVFGASAPTAETKAATGVTLNKATLNASVNPNSSATTYQFEYCQLNSEKKCTSSYTTVPLSPSEIGGGMVSVTVNQTITGLQYHKDHQYRVVAQNALGKSYGNFVEFNTSVPAPKVTTQAAIDISASGATLGGTVDPNGALTGYRYEYGTTTAYGQSVPSEFHNYQETAYDASESVSGFAPSTTYHYRIAARNSVGQTSYGEDKTFTTASGG